MPSITTTEGKVFSHMESVDLARLVRKRFGKDAPDAWRRMLENQCSDSDFYSLVDYPEHTPNCEGHCTRGD